MENCINFYWEQNQKKREVSILDLGRENVGDPKLLLGAGWQAARQSTLGTGSFKYSHSLSSHRKVKLGGLCLHQDTWKPFIHSGILVEFILG